MKKTNNHLRKNISSATKQLVLLEAGYMCANPRCRHILTLELHHIEWVKDGGGNEPSNLLALCPNCHAQHTAGYIPYEAIRVWKGLLLALNNTNRANVDTLLYLYKQNQDPIGSRIHYSGDTLLYLAGLINAGLVKRESGQVSSSGSSFEIKLTDEGLMLIEAWLVGNEVQLNRVLHQKFNSDTT